MRQGGLRRGRQHARDQRQIIGQAVVNHDVGGGWRAAFGAVNHPQSANGRAKVERVETHILEYLEGRDRRDSEGGKELGFFGQARLLNVARRVKRQRFAGKGHRLGQHSIGAGDCHRAQWVGWPEF